VTSGLRVGTPALATRGFSVADFEEVGDIIATALIQGTSGQVEVEALRARVRALTDAHPLYVGLNQ
jgi:glycine hydroxymethyltransferase